MLNAATGEPYWTFNLLKEVRGSNIQWGLSESPLVLNDRILVNAGGTIVALRKTDGSAIWKTGGDEAGYSSAVAHKVGNVNQAIFFTSVKAIGVDIDSGRQLCLPDTRLKIAVFIDFDNIEIGVKSTLNLPFDIGVVLESTQRARRS